MTIPNDISSLQCASTESFDAFSELVTPLSENQFFAPFGKKWSPAQHQQHLILANRGVGSVLKRPKSFFEQFGRAQQPSRTYQQQEDYWRRTYREPVIAPAQVVPGDDLPERTTLLANWTMIRDKIEARLPENWTEKELDTYQIPHYKFGLMTMREMMHFIILHNYHHVRLLRSYLNGRV